MSNVSWLLCNKHFVLPLSNLTTVSALPDGQLREVSCSDISSNSLCTGYFVLLQGVALARRFEELVLEDPRFEIPAPRYLGMVVFRLKVSRSEEF